MVENVTNSQILTVVGLILEFASVLIALRKLFWGKDKRIDDKIRTSKQMTKSNKIEGVTTLTLLTIGVFLQALAVFF